MDTTIIILAIASAGIACFALLDYALLRHLRDASLRRMGLVLAMLSVLVVPLVGASLPERLPWLISEPEPMVETPLSPEMLLALMEASAEVDLVPVTQSWWQTIDWMGVLGWLWLAGVAFSTLTLVVRLISLGRLIARSHVVGHHNGIEIRQYQSDRIPPFSTMGRIFIPEHIPQGALREHILLHEAAHVQSWHMLDSLLAEIFCIVYWFHPLSYILRHQQRTNLEYCADQDVLGSGQVNKRAYQLNLVSMCASSEAFPLCLSFRTKEVLKQRIIMMNQSQSPRRGLRWSLMLALPIVGAMLSVANALATPATEEATTEAPEVITLNEQAPQNGDPIFEVVEEPAQYPGGAEAMTKWLAANLKYPEAALKGNISGRVFVTFVVDKDGTILNPEILRSVHPALDQEALRVVKAMPKWTAGKMRGKAVKVKMSVPIIFRLSNDGGTGDIFAVVEDQPQFPGGSEAMMKWIAANVKYPEAAQKENISGRVFVSFVIDKDGTILEPKILRSVHPALDQEALRVVKAMPKWIPGKMRGKSVKTTFSIPIVFRLQGSEPKTSSLASAQLVIIDGKEASAEKMQELNPSDIASVNVLKGEKAVVAYGERGREGAIIITTKTGKGDEPTRLVISSSEEGISEADMDKLLLIVDGQEVSLSQMQAIDPQTISSIKVLKGDKAESLYGEKGKSGVIIITSKEASSSK